MRPLFATYEQLSAFVEFNSRYVGNVSILVFTGDPEDGEHFDISERFLTDTLPRVLNGLGDTDGTPSVFNCIDNLEHCPVGIAVIVGGEGVLLPMLDLPQIEEELNSVLADIDTFEEEAPSAEDEIKTFVSSRLFQHRARSLGWLSTYMALGELGQTCGWVYLTGSQFDTESGTSEKILLVVTGPDSSGDYWTYSWVRFWGVSPDPDGLHSSFNWTSPTVTVEYRDVASDTVDFWIADEGGSIKFQASTESFKWLADYAESQGIALVDLSQNEPGTGSNLTASYINHIVPGNGNVTTHRPGAVSPTPNAQASTQPPGASVHDGIIQGNANVSGLAVIRGIVEGNVNVPAGADVNILGIVEGMVRVHGGVARLFGTAGAAEISSGRIELYGILESPLRYSGGEVYYAPGSVIEG